MSSRPPWPRTSAEASASQTVAGMPWTCRTRASVSPPRPAPTIVTEVAMRWILRCRGVSGTVFQTPRLEHRSRYVKMRRMTTRPRHPERREDALSRERIVGAAVELLDDKGESGLTFRALAAQL